MQTGPLNSGCGQKPPVTLLLSCLTVLLSELFCLHGLLKSIFTCWWFQTTLGSEDRSPPLNRPPRVYCPDLLTPTEIVQTFVLNVLRNFWSICSNGWSWNIRCCERRRSQVRGGWSRRGRSAEGCPHMGGTMRPAIAVKKKNNRKKQFKTKLYQKWGGADILAYLGIKRKICYDIYFFQQIKLFFYHFNFY